MTTSTRRNSPKSGLGRRIQTRRSGVHGKGVYAVEDIAAGERLIEYKGEVITWKEALRRHPHDPKDPNHTFYFHIDDKHVIDAKYGGNSARWINHSCNPNCETEVEGKRVYIEALRDIRAGEELFYDYGLVIDAPQTPELLAEYPCWCGSANCRGTLLTPPDEVDGGPGDLGKKNTKKKKNKKSSKKHSASESKQDKAESKGEKKTKAKAKRKKEKA